MLLSTINGPADVKKLNFHELEELSEEIRKTMLEKISKRGGHLASNLGIVEITVGLHYVFCSPSDKIIFDVSHQSYTHKILTGRKKAFMDEECYDDVSGYSNPAESPHDFFNIGHTSTSISLACGMAKARDVNKKKENIVAVIGDAALDGGEAFEALNYASELNSGLIVVINDNNMSIPENHGSLNGHLNELHRNNGILNDNYFRALGWEYIFVDDGNDIKKVIPALESVKDTNHPVVVHFRTVKGKGYLPAETDPEKWHWAHPFVIDAKDYVSTVPKENYGAIVSNYLLKKMKQDSKVVVVAASTPLCIGFNLENRKRAGSQFLDVGIAEQHAVSMTAGLAISGCKPVFATNSTFYQRAYDQIEQEMCISKCPASMILTHTGLRGHTNDTHAGLFDIALFSDLANLTFLAPTCCEEYLSMLEWSIEQTEGPVMIRVPWNGVYHTERSIPFRYDKVRYEIVEHGKDAAIFGLGSFYQTAQEVVELLKKQGVTATLINPRFASGLDEKCLSELIPTHRVIVTLEDGIIDGGFGSKIARFYAATDRKVLVRGFDSAIPTTYDPAELLRKNNLLPEQIAADVMKYL